LLQCYQSKKDFDQKKNDLLPKYTEILNKEIASKKLSIEDEYIKLIYGVFGDGGKEYRVFENILNSGAPNSEEELAKTANLLEFVYCPDVNKIPIVYPLTLGGCSELLLTMGAFDRPLMIPHPGDYQVVEEYNLALQKLRVSLKDQAELARKCCIGQDRSANCVTSLVTYIK